MSMGLNDRKRTRVQSVSLRKDLYQLAAIEAADNHAANLRDNGHRPVSISAILNELLENRYKRLQKKAQ